MRTSALLFRIAGPSLLVSLFFLVSCAAAAVYLHQRQTATLRTLDEDLHGRRLIDALLKDLNELVEISLAGGDSDRVATLHDDIQRLLAESNQAVKRPEEARIVDRLAAGFDRYRESLRAEGGAAPARRGRGRLAILETDLRIAARELDARNAEEMGRSQAEMHRTASWMAWGLVAVGAAATAAGLFFGYGVARGLERDVLRAEEMAAVGRMAAGMAHELRNPLTAISMLIQLQREKAEEDGLPTEDLQVVEREIVRMEERLTAFIDFARPSRPNGRLIDPADVVAEKLALLQGRAAKQRVELNFRPPAEPVRVEADPEQIGRVLMNLAGNAMDAMPLGGRLDIALTRADDGFVDLTVDDTGPGIGPADPNRLFEPFHTSKEAGLGLGLAISRRIAQDHGGRLVASNRPEGGARFVLRLPAAKRVNAEAG